MKVLQTLVYLSATLLFAAMNPLPVQAQNSQTLKWELVNPFRFIRDQPAIDELRQVYDGLPDKTAARLERALQDMDENEVVEGRRLANAKCQVIENAKKRKECIEKARIPFRGWFAKLAENKFVKTCWDPKAKTYRSDGDCENYVNPIKHYVRVWLDEPQPISTETAKWYKNSEPLTDFRKCERSSICIEFPLPYDEAASTTISLTYADQRFTTNEPLRVVDRLIVGLGDSFASGEGNPDIPAQFKDGKTESDLFYQGWKRIRSPIKDKGTEVSWLDKECHRSMYSYQFKTALHFALSNPKQAVTFISFACSGAETINIYGKKQKPKEGNVDVKEQLIALRNVLTRTERNVTVSSATMRQIDYLLLSTGGNDIGFAHLVANIVLHGSRRSIFKLTAGEIPKRIWAGEPGVIEKTLLNSETGNYRILNRKLADGENGIRLKGENPTESLSRIILTAYPDALANEGGNLCELDRFEFNSPFGSDQNRGKRLKSANDSVFLPLQTVQAKVEAELGWTLVTDHVEKFKTHGVCAQKKSEVGRTGEEFVMPRFHRQIWDPFEPWEYRTYESRQRWIRLPVDSKLSVDQRRGRIDLFFEDDWSTIMHPSAEGLAETADANIKAIRKLELKHRSREPTPNF